MTLLGEGEPTKAETVLLEKAQALLKEVQEQESEDDQETEGD